MELRELAMDLRSGALSPVDHVEQVLARMDALGDGPYANLVVARDDERACTSARTAKQEIRDGRWRGPLHGVAVAIKDNIDVAGLPTRAGSHILDDDPAAAQDAPVVARLRAAGAIVVAKTHLHELAYGPTGAISADGPAANPHDATRITGGSSSGSAALVALGVVALALGTDTGCSVRTPAALCGVTGLKPTLGSLSTAGVAPLSTTLDHVGVLGADTHAVAVAWDVLARGGEATGGGIQAPGVRGLRVGLPRSAALRVLEPEIEAAVDAAVATLRRGGAEVSEFELPDVEELVASYGVIVGCEAHATHAEALRTRPQAFQAVTAQRLGAQAGRGARTYIDALRSVERIRARTRTLTRELDALVLATTPLRATPIGTDDHGSTTVREALLSLGIPFSVLGLPAVSVPAPGVVGLPIGIQVVGARLEERGILRVAAALG